MSVPQEKQWELSASVAALAEDFYAVVGNCYPVCAASDEFYYFPQVLPPERNWDRWDDFSDDRVAEFSRSLENWEQQLARLATHINLVDTQIDIRMLRGCLQTLREQLTEVAPQRNQPTFHLMIVVAGLSEALSSSDPQAWSQRISGLPEFLQRAEKSLAAVPKLFLDLGQQMLADLLSWLARLEAEGYNLGTAVTALQHFGSALTAMKSLATFTLPLELAERIFTEHIGTEHDSAAALVQIEQELQEMTSLLRSEAEQLSPGRSWLDVKKQIPAVAVGATDLLEVYRRELTQLEQHCRSASLLPGGLPTDTGLRVARVPASLSAIRASDAYNATPGFPPQGGIFYVQRKKLHAGGRFGLTQEYRMTAAHETWPGHHLLDWARWAQEHSLRRPLENPLYYEGWACLAEELMARSGYFNQPWDRFILAHRRLKRAARGKVDLGLQTGRMNISEAFCCLEQVGFSAFEARSIVPKYLLRPGYQVCYTLGLRRFLALLDAYAGGQTGRWIDLVLAHGEIHLDDLELKLQEEFRQ